jgi:hypothetical protein
VVAAGTPEEIVKVKESHTGYWLAPVLRGGAYPERAKAEAAASARQPAELEVA